MRVLMLVQQMDAGDWLRAFILDWVNALAQTVTHVDVITLEKGTYTIPQNVTVTSLGKENGKNRARELLAFHTAMRELAPQADVIFSHMTPRYTLLAAPYARRYGKRQVLWYTHRNPSRQLRLALRAAWRVATAMPESFPIKSPKVRALGHGIDTHFYAPPRRLNESNRVVQVARLMPIKHQPTLIRALAQVPDAHAVFVGDVPVGQEEHQGYADGLRTLAGAVSAADRVTFAGGLLAPAVREQYHSAAVAVNLSPDGLFDKAALESMACGVPTIVSSRAFDSLLGDDADRLRIAGPEDIDGLAARLKDLLALTPAERLLMGERLRARVVEAHGLERLMLRLARLFATGEPE